MAMPPRLAPLLAQFDYARGQLIDRLVGLTDDEYRWEPVPSCWTIRPSTTGPGPGATVLIGGGDWGRDYATPAPEPAPFTTLAWRLGHLTESLARRADYTNGSHSLTRAAYRYHGDAALIGADDAALDRVGHCGYPNGSDPDDPFIAVIWWENQEILHHGAEIALLRDLYRAQRR